MPFVRRFLPSITFLCSFESAARQLSFTAAARELNLTQSAVSRHIRMLEDRLGTPLFVRDRQTVKLTRAGELYALEIRSALEVISEATLELRACPSGQALNIGIEATLGVRWLLPALQNFYNQYPNVDINIISDLNKDNIDIFIRLPKDEDNDFIGREILCAPIIPVCAPSLLKRYPVIKIEDMEKAPLLHLTSRPDLWERWFESQSFYPEAVNGTLFDQYTTILGAAVSGVGIALLPRVLVQNELASGTLIELTHKEEIIDKYSLFYKKDNEKISLIRNFVSSIERNS